MIDINFYKTAGQYAQKLQTHQYNFNLKKHNLTAKELTRFKSGIV